MNPSDNTTGRVMVYGAAWCHDTRDTLRHLDHLGIPYEYHDIDTEPGAEEWVMERNGGKRKLPTVAVGAQILSIPDNAELDAALEAR